MVEEAAHDVSRHGLLLEGLDCLRDRLGVGALPPALPPAQHTRSVLLLGHVCEVEVEANGPDQLERGGQVQALHQGKEPQNLGGAPCAQADGRSTDLLHLLEEGPSRLGEEHLTEQFGQVVGAPLKVGRHGKSGALAHCPGHQRPLT